MTAMVIAPYFLIPTFKFERNLKIGKIPIRGVFTF